MIEPFPMWVSPQYRAVFESGVVSHAAIRFPTISDGVNTQIVSGLQVGDQVVTGVSSASAKSGSTSGSSIFNLGGPGGGNGGASNNRSSGTTTTTNQRGG